MEQLWWVHNIFGLYCITSDIIILVKIIYNQKLLVGLLYCIIPDIIVLVQIIYNQKLSYWDIDK